MPILRNAGRRTILPYCLVLLALCPSVRNPLWAETPVSKEYQVKAVFLYNFAQFVQWPSTAFRGAGEPFCIGVLGDDPFDGFLDDIVKGETVGGRPLVVRRCNSLEEAESCHILFVSRSETKEMDKILARLINRNILTVGDTEGFDENGGIVRFVKEGNKIHFRINLDAAKKVHLTISSKVLRLAEIVKPGKD